MTKFFAEASPLHLMITWRKQCSKCLELLHNAILNKFQNDFAYLAITLYYFQTRKGNDLTD